MKTVRHLPLLACSLLAGCFHAPSAGDQKAAFAQSMGNPTQKSQADLDATIAQQTQGFMNTGVKQSVQLAAPALSIDAQAGTCYTLVMHLAQGAAWGAGAEAGIRFEFDGPGGHGTGGPGVVGPGAVVSVDCPPANGTVTLAMSPMVQGDTSPLGTGALEVEVWSHELTADETANREASRARDIKEQQDFAREQAQRNQKSCQLCETRYQGCIGAGVSRHACEESYQSCVFDNVYAHDPSGCSNHQP
jgi:hypothetical protein